MPTVPANALDRAQRVLTAVARDIERLRQHIAEADRQFMERYAQPARA